MPTSQPFKNFDAPFPTRLRELMQGQPETNNKTLRSQLASAIGVTRQTVSDYMNGSVAPDCYRAAAIAKYFNVSVDYLLGITDDQTPDTSDKAFCAATGLSANGLRYVKHYNKLLSFLAEHRKEQNLGGNYTDILSIVEDIVTIKKSNKIIAFDNKGDAKIEPIEYTEELDEWELDKCMEPNAPEHIKSQQTNLTDLTLQYYKQELTTALDAIRATYQDSTQSN